MEASKERKTRTSFSSASLEEGDAESLALTPATADEARSGAVGSSTGNRGRRVGRRTVRSWFLLDDGIV